MREKPRLCTPSSVACGDIFSPKGGEEQSQKKNAGGVKPRPYAENGPRAAGASRGPFLHSPIQSFTCARSQSAQASMPSPVREEIGRMTMFGFSRRTYCVHRSMSKSK